MPRGCKAAAAALSLLLSGAPAAVQGEIAAELTVDDECRTDGGAECALNALQRRGMKAGPAKLNEQCGGKDYHNGPTECEPGAVCNELNEWYSQCQAGAAPSATKVQTITSTNDDSAAGSFEASNASAASKASPAAEASSATGPKCASLDTPQNDVCAPVVRWAHQGGRYDTHAEEWFKDMKDIAGVSYKEASLEDWQKLYFCAPPGGTQCGSPPCSCSHPPCNVCFGGAATKSAADSSACEGGNEMCKPPKTALEYNGKEWPTKNVSGIGPHHIFAIGDWGGLDGSLHPVEGRPQMIAYSGGGQAGPSVFPRTRWNLHHSKLLCSHKQFIACYNSKGVITGNSPDSTGCVEGCGYVEGIDNQPQQLVAAALKARAAKNGPAVILNVGDNFYWGGIEKTCGTAMSELSYPAHHQYTQIFEGVYNGPGVDGVPWYSVLGNHDWGGRVFNNGWDQQIAYTWKSNRWIMPAAYYTAKVDFPDAGFTMELFMTDSNAMDAHELDADPEHNICGAKHNSPSATCASQGGPSSLETCRKWFWDMWDEQKVWLPKKLDASKATWQVLVTHFPCGHQKDFYEQMHNSHGLDLMVTGHRHDQELWSPDRMGGLTCFVTGGGGGISSEATPNIEDKEDWYGEAQYGFYDLTVTKETISIESINFNGTLMASATVHPK